LCSSFQWSKAFRVRLTREAEADLDRLFDFVLERELERDGWDLTLAKQAVAAIRAGFATLKISPFTCRKAGQRPFLRELIIPSGGQGTSRSSRSSRRPMWWSLPSATSSRTTTTDAVGWPATRASYILASSASDAIIAWHPPRVVDPIDNIDQVLVTRPRLRVSWLASVPGRADQRLRSATKPSADRTVVPSRAQERAQQAQRERA
jgi:hypothetical protein